MQNPKIILILSNQVKFLRYEVVKELLLTPLSAFITFNFGQSASQKANKENTSENKLQKIKIIHYTKTNHE